ncbi:MauE/DoxX family redox-associated membrane protein [Chitinophaga sp. MM2321]|uniref:MauE/DoxX family redox-associated membrane protein n=1 Tax=Chitinophaga sp. MM2321 TaxID=3137178 RepID=UPI0032D5747B
MNKIRQWILGEGIPLLYICLLLYTAISKLMQYDLTREQMAVMPVISPFSGIVTWLLPVSEIIIALVVFVPRTRRIGLYLSTGLMIGFTMYVAYMMKFFSHLPCTCGGFLQNLTWPQHLLFNLFFVLIGVIAILASRFPIKEINQGRLKYSR